MAHMRMTLHSKDFGTVEVDVRSIKGVEAFKNRTVISFNHGSTVVVTEDKETVLDLCAAHAPYGPDWHRPVAWPLKVIG